MDQEIAASLARIEQRQAVYEVVANKMLSALDVHTEMLQAVMQAATADPGPSPVAEALTKILATMEETNRLLQHLPDAISATIREELQDDYEPAEGAFAGESDRDG
jgi:hypothetical protein